MNEASKIFFKNHCEYSNSFKDFANNFSYKLGTIDDIDLKFFNFYNLLLIFMGILGNPV
jgi:hypothetical protein